MIAYIGARARSTELSIADSSMSFFARVLNHLVNEVLVNSLANNRTFQQIAVRSNAWVADIAKKSALYLLAHLFTIIFRTFTQY